MSVVAAAVSGGSSAGEDTGSYRIMPAKNRNLHGSAPDKSETALLIIDVINDLDFPEANQLMRYAPAMARRIAKLKESAHSGHLRE